MFNTVFQAGVPGQLEAMFMCEQSVIPDDFELGTIDLELVMDDLERTMDEPELTMNVGDHAKENKSVSGA